MFDNAAFARLIEQKQPTGEVVSVDRFLVGVAGLETASAGALVLFENGAEGMVREVRGDTVLVLNLSAEDIDLGTLAVLFQEQIEIPVGEAMLGRVISVLSRPLDGKGAMNLTATRQVFAPAPPVHQRQLLNQQLPTGVAMVDMLFPVVLGQRIAVIGDSKTGKTSFLAQVTSSQVGSGRVVIYVVIGKRKVDIDNLLAKLQATGAMKHTIVVVANIFDSLAQSYLAPYVAAAIGEYFWYDLKKDVVVIYDDLSSHAKVYRELSLLAHGYPGRESYPGDMFFAHSSLLERAGKLVSTGKTMTALPVVLTPNDDITAYLSTSIMSITDGQIIFDMESFRQGIRPAVNVGLSVSRVGGRAQTQRRQKLSGSLFKKLAEYRQAMEFSHFGSELALESQASLELGKRIYEAFKQGPDEIYTLEQQELYLSAVLKTEGKVKINVDSVKQQSKAAAAAVKSEAEIDPAIDKLLRDNTIQANGSTPAIQAAAPASAPAPAAAATAQAQPAPAQQPATNPAPVAPPPTENKS